jgi:hypothetical protein
LALIVTETERRAYRSGSLKRKARRRAAPDRAKNLAEKPLPNISPFFVAPRVALQGRAGEIFE